jgi:hypothetical protein
MNRDPLKPIAGAANQLQGLRHDDMRHFSKDGPAWRLAALFICKLAGILGALAALAAAVPFLR